MIYFSLFIIVLSASLAMCEVKTQVGEYRLIQRDQLSKEVYLHRVYSSRTLEKGYFGYNWCSELDLKLFIKDMISIAFFDCISGRYVTFSKSADSLYSSSHPRYKIRKDRQIYVVTTDTDEYAFDIDGKITSWNFLKIKVNYSRKIPIHIQDTFKEWSVTLDSKKSLITGIGPVHNYSYNYQTLSAAKDKQYLDARFTYDAFLNMTRWSNKHHWEEITYDTEWDRVTSWVSKDLCRHEFTYTHTGKNKKIQETKKCLTPQQSPKNSKNRALANGDSNENH